MKRILSCLLILAMLFGIAGAFAAEEEITDHEFVYALLDNGTYEVIGYKLNRANVKIPTEYEGIKVTAIGKEAFANKSGIAFVNMHRCG